MKNPMFVFRQTLKRTRKANKLVTPKHKYNYSRPIHKQEASNDTKQTLSIAINIYTVGRNKYKMHRFS